jgi:hypothetical protein
MLILTMFLTMFLSSAQAQEPAPPKYDCLGGICLNSPASAKSKTLVTASDHKWARETSVCSGKVVSVSLTATWSQDGFTWSDAIPGSNTKIGVGDGTLAFAVYERVAGAMVDLGWTLISDKSLVYAHPEKIGTRGLFFNRSDDGPPNGWTVTLLSLHPDHEALCRKKNTQGL